MHISFWCSEIGTVYFIKTNVRSAYFINNSYEQFYFFKTSRLPVIAFFLIHLTATVLKMSLQIKYRNASWTVMLLNLFAVNSYDVLVRIQKILVYENAGK